MILLVLTWVYALGVILMIVFTSGSSFAEVVRGEIPAHKIKWFKVTVVMSIILWPFFWLSFGVEELMRKIGGNR